MKEKALIEFLDLNEEERKLLKCSSDENTFEYKDETYLVLTEDERELWLDEYISNHIEDYIYTSIPQCYWQYFDSESFKEDNRGDAGSWLSSYDGVEHEIEVDYETYYIYRN